MFRCQLACHLIVRLDTGIGRRAGVRARKVIAVSQCPEDVQKPAPARHTIATQLLITGDEHGLRPRRIGVVIISTWAAQKATMTSLTIAMKMAAKPGALGSELGAATTSALDVWPKPPLHPMTAQQALATGRKAGHLTSRPGVAKSLMWAAQRRIHLIARQALPIGVQAGPC